MPGFPRFRSRFREMIARRVRWDDWEAVIREHGVTIERPAGEPHPEYAHILYPVDYGFVPHTVGTDGEPLDCFVGTAATDRRAGGLVGAILTNDYRKGDREVKLLYRCTPTEIYTAHGFINYDRTLLDGLLVLRHPMHTLWKDEEEK